MRNALKYYYNIDVYEIKNENDIFLFDNYMLKELQYQINFDLYHFMLNEGLKIHRIIFNKEGSYYTKINGKNYVLYYLCEFADVNIDIINKYSEFNFGLNDLSQCIKLWETKVDFYEASVFSNCNKHLSMILPYYIGLSELAIRILNENNYKITYTISHRRINSYYDFFCPDNIVLDCAARDYAEYFKKIFFEFDNINFNKYLESLKKIKLSKEDYIVFFSRMCFPTYFFDSIELESNTNVYVSKTVQFEKLLFYINNDLNKKYDLNIIDWIKKT